MNKRQQALLNKLAEGTITDREVIQLARMLEHDNTQQNDQQDIEKRLRNMGFNKARRNNDLLTARNIRRAWKGGFGKLTDVAKYNYIAQGTGGVR